MIMYFEPQARDFLLWFLPQRNALRYKHGHGWYYAALWFWDVDVS